MSETSLYVNMEKFDLVLQISIFQAVKRAQKKIYMTALGTDVVSDVGQTSSNGNVSGLLFSTRSKLVDVSCSTLLSE